MLHPAGKMLLRNSILNADAFNRSNEEQMMWQQRNNVNDWDRQREINCRSSRHSGRTTDRTTTNVSRQARFEHVRYHKSAGKADSSTVEGMDEILSPSYSSNFWLRKLAECKEADPDKWHHDGFKQLYPKDLAPSVNRSSSPLHGCLGGRSVEGSHRKEKRGRRSSRRTSSSDRLSEKKKKKSKKKKSKKERQAKF